MTGKFKVLAGIAVFVGIVLGLLYVPFWAWQSLKIYSAESTGKAELAQARYNRQIIAETAEQEKLAAKFKKETAIINAEGIAEANRIIADGLGGAEGYLRYLWIQSISENEQSPTIIYVPTEAGLPLLEAGRLGDQ